MLLFQLLEFGTELFAGPAEQFDAAGAAITFKYGFDFACCKWNLHDDLAME
jgi:hypothetical protein